MSAATYAPQRARADESPFEMPGLTSGYPLDAAEKAAITKVLEAARQADQQPRSDDSDRAGNS